MSDQSSPNVVPLEPRSPGIFKGVLAMFPDPSGEYVRLSDAQSALQAKEAEIAALKVKAERYDWLRDQADPDSEQAHCTIHKTNDWGKWFNEWLTGEALDEHIDAAIDSSRAAVDGEGKSE